MYLIFALGMTLLVLIFLGWICVWDLMTFFFCWGFSIVVWLDKFGCMVLQIMLGSLFYVYVHVCLLDENPIVFLCEIPTKFLYKVPSSPLICFSWSPAYFIVALGPINCFGSLLFDVSSLFHLFQFIFVIFLKLLFWTDLLNSNLVLLICSDIKSYFGQTSCVVDSIFVSSFLPDFDVMWILILSSCFIQ